MALRSTPPLVGLATSINSLQDTSANGAGDAYDARIMHRAVDSTLVQTVVKLDASDVELANALNIQPNHVRAHFLTSRTPIIDPRPPATPQLPHHCSTASETRFRRRPQMVPLSLLQRYRDMAVDLRNRLNAISNPPPPRRPEQYYAAKAEPVSIDDSTSTDSSTSAVGSFEPTSNLVSLNHSQRPCCGLSVNGKYVTQAVDAPGAVIRKYGGLYSGARHSKLVGRGECAYVEFNIAYTGGKGGIAVGVANEKYSLDKMVGNLKGSMAIHSDAKLVRAGTWFDTHGDNDPFGSGDVVGLFVSVSKSGRVVMRASINGEFAGELVGDEALQKCVVDGQRVQVMVSMLRPGARVALKCCPSEWRFSPFVDDTPVQALCKRNLKSNHTDDRTSAVLTP